MTIQKSTLLIIIFIFIALFVIYLLIRWSWNINHTCSICKNTHINQDELSKCIKCDKYFCTDKSDKYEKIKVTVESQIEGELGIH